MTAPLSRHMAELLATVPRSWQPIPSTANGQTLKALKDRGLVRTRLSVKRRSVTVHWKRAR